MNVIRLLFLRKSFFYNVQEMKTKIPFLLLLFLLCSCNGREMSTASSPMEEISVSQDDKTVSVFLDPKGGELQENQIFLKYHQPYSLPVPQAVSSMGNVDFLGWYHLGVQVAMVGESFPFSDDVALTAKWKNTDFSFRKTTSGYEVSSFLGHAREVVIPSMYDGEKVTSISSNVFRNRKDIHSVSLPDTILEIGHEAFYHCSHLEALTMSSNLERIGYSAFEGCKELADVFYPSKVDSWIGIDFEESSNPCMNSATLYFENEPLTEISLKGISSLPGEVFHGVKNRMNVIMDDSVVSIGESAFLSSGLTSIRFSKNVSQIQDDCFKECYYLERVSLPEKIKELPESLFSSCFALKEATLPSDIDEIPSSLFENCYALESVSLKEGFKDIGTNAFSGCRKLSSILFPSSLERIEAGAFSKCTSLRKIHIPKNVVEIKQGAFSTTSGVEEVSVDRENSVYHSKMNTILDREGNVLYGCKDSVLEEGIRKILPQAFFGCYGLKKLSLPSSLESIGDYAFSNSCLESLEIKENLNDIGKNAFTGDSELKEIKVSNLNSSFSAVDDCLLDKEGKMLLLGCKNSRIPESVTDIGEESFYYNSGLVSIRIPYNVRTISKRAFSHCYSLSEIELEDGLSKIGEEAFSFCYALSEIRLPSSLVETGESSFAFCISLRKAVLSSLKELPAGLFDGCSFLQEVHIPKCTQAIAPTCFRSCSALSEIDIEEGNPYYVFQDHVLSDPDRKNLYFGCFLSEIPESIETICEYAFYGQSLPSLLTLKEGVRVIEEEAFGQCAGLSYLILPKTIERIHENAFEGSKELSRVEFEGSLKAFGKVSLGFGCFYDTDVDRVFCLDGAAFLLDECLE